MSRQIRTRTGPTPATSRASRRPYDVPEKRKPQPRALRLVMLPCAVVYAESVAELIVLTHRARTNQAPLATGRYRR